MEDKKIFGLLNGIAKKDYYGGIELSNEFLKEKLFPDLTTDDFQVILSQYELILKNMIYSDMDLKQLDAYLTSLAHKKQHSISEEHKLSIIKFWKTNKQKLHSLITQKATFNNHLKTFKWRVDLDYKDNNQTSEPKVVFEIGLNQKDESEKLVFESDGKALVEMIKQMETIKEVISNASK